MHDMLLRCYVAKRRLETAMLATGDKYSFSVDWQAFMLRADYPARAPLGVPRQVDTNPLIPTRAGISTPKDMKCFVGNPKSIFRFREANLLFPSDLASEGTQHPIHEVSLLVETIESV